MQSGCRGVRRIEHYWSKVYSRDRLSGGMMVRSPLSIWGALCGSFALWLLVVAVVGGRACGAFFRVLTLDALRKNGILVSPESAPCRQT